jgi:hypothetical protein
MEFGIAFSTTFSTTHLHKCQLACDRPVTTISEVNQARYLRDRNSNSQKFNGLYLPPTTIHMSCIATGDALKWPTGDCQQTAEGSNRADLTHRSLTAMCWDGKFFF